MQQPGQENKSQRNTLSLSMADLSYEQAYAELEEIVYGLEANQKTLEEAISLYERGQALAQHCASLLDQAELRVQSLNDMAEGTDPDLDEPEGYAS